MFLSAVLSNFVKVGPFFHLIHSNANMLHLIVSFLSKINYFTNHYSKISIKMEINGFSCLIISVYITIIRFFHTGIK